MFCSRRSVGAGSLVTLALAAGVLSGLLPGPAAAQHPFTPGVAFGADVFPYVDGSRNIWAVQFDLFSELSKDLVKPGEPTWPPPGPALGDFQKYNDIEQTIGFNQIGHTWVRASQVGAFWWHKTFWAAGGVVWDATTEFIQNDAAHGVRQLTYVPRDGTIDHAVLGLGTDQSLSWAALSSGPVGLILVGGVGTGLSTSYMELYGQIGAELSFGGPQPWLQLGGLGRIGRVNDYFYWEGLNVGLGNDYLMWQAWALLGFDALLAWAPRLRVGFTRSRGPFKEALALGGDPIVERLWSIRMESPAGQWAVETWNDFVFKDLGPTFGLRIQWYR